MEHDGWILCSGKGLRTYRRSKHHLALEELELFPRDRLGGKTQGTLIRIRPDAWEDDRDGTNDSAVATGADQ